MIIAPADAPNAESASRMVRAFRAVSTSDQDEFNRQRTHQDERCNMVKKCKGG
jgi:hypothetical protein